MRALYRSPISDNPLTGYAFTQLKKHLETHLADRQIELPAGGDNIYI
jgi:hypothetical protein